MATNSTDFYALVFESSGHQVYRGSLLPQYRNPIHKPEALPHVSPLFVVREEAVTDLPAVWTQI
ncbi:protein of unknown function [Candidatus Methylomirabilis oxygeniifera]|uniref:Uncharacterized protein n=1 Tax=Methylomirabilis oxygeniifera TaxID=671143 RepID=D5MGE5_METO1|nr:protein of unknown function [Candidatus Methylomirabilis oxyfera]